MLLKLLAFVDRLMVFVAVVALAGMMMLIVVSVSGRYVLNSPVTDDVIITELAMAFLVFLPLGAVQASREHVFVSLFTDPLGERAKAVFDGFGLIVGALVVSIFVVATYLDFQGAYESGAYMDSINELPEYPARLAIFLGFLGLLVRLVIDLALTVQGLIGGNGVSTGSDRNHSGRIER